MRFQQRLAYWIGDANRHPVLIPSAINTRASLQGLGH